MREVFLYCDGAVRGNGGPGRIGMGVILACPGTGLTREYHWGEDLDRATNIIAELAAIEGGLARIKLSLRAGTGVTVITDSLWSIEAITGKWPRTVHDRRVHRIRQLMHQFGAVSFRHVKGHAGHEQNERCDALARQAVAEP